MDSNLACPVRAPALGVADVLHVVDVAHCVLLAPDDGVAGETGAARVDEETFGAGEVGAPVLGEVEKELACLSGQGVGHAEHDAFA